MFDLLLTLWGYLGVVWCVANLLYAYIRNNAKPAMFYGASIALSAVVVLNIGGVLNERTWALFGSAILGVHGLWYLWRGPRWVGCIMLFVAATSALVIL